MLVDGSGRILQAIIKQILKIDESALAAKEYSRERKLCDGSVPGEFMEHQGG